MNILRRRLANLAAPALLLCAASAARAQPPVMPPAADFNRDHRPDLIWLGESKGSFHIWSMGGGAQGEELLDGASIDGNGFTAGWRLAGADDFNGDGFTDLFFQSDTGLLGAWAYTESPYSPGSRFDYAITLTPGRVSDPNWQVRAVGDMNHDGHPDLIWQYAPTGQVAFWLMNGTTAIDYVVPDVDAPGDDWEIVGTGDSNRDGERDIFWQQRSTGMLAVWWMHNTSIGGASLMSASPDPKWRVVAVADLDGDAYTDLIFQHVDTRVAAAWYLQANIVRFGLSLVPSTAALPDYRIVGPR